MPNYLLTYHGEAGPMPEDHDITEQIMAQWAAWYETIGADLVDGGAPFAFSAALGPDGSSTENPAQLSGYTIVKAADMAAATTIAQGCPVLANGHSVQISESIDMG